MKVPPRQFGVDFAPTCDRCGRLPQRGGVLEGRTMQFVCFGCLSAEEHERFCRGEAPFEASSEDG